MAVNQLLGAISVERAVAIVGAAVDAYHTVRGGSWKDATIQDKDFYLLKMQHAFNELDAGFEPQFEGMDEQVRKIMQEVAGEAYREYRTEVDRSNSQ